MEQENLPENLRRTQRITENLFRGAGFTTFPLLLSFGFSVSVSDGNELELPEGEALKIQLVNIPDERALKSVIQEAKTRHIVPGSTSIALVTEARLAERGKVEEKVNLTESDFNDRFPQVELVLMLIYCDSEGEVYSVGHIAEPEGDPIITWETTGILTEIKSGSPTPLFLDAFRRNG